MGTAPEGRVLAVVATAGNTAEGRGGWSIQPGSIMQTLGDSEPAQGGPGSLDLCKVSNKSIQREVQMISFKVDLPS